MRKITDFGEVQKVRAPAGYQWSRSAILADDLEVLHTRLATLSGILSRQLASVDRLLSILPDASCNGALTETVKIIRGPLMEADRLLNRERHELKSLREQRFKIYGRDAAGSDISCQSENAEEKNS